MGFPACPERAAGESKGTLDPVAQALTIVVTTAATYSSASKAKRRLLVRIFEVGVAVEAVFIESQQPA